MSHLEARRPWHVRWRRHWRPEETPLRDVHGASLAPGPVATQSLSGVALTLALTLALALTPALVADTDTGTGTGTGTDADTGADTNTDTGTDAGADIPAYVDD